MALLLLPGFLVSVPRSRPLWRAVAAVHDDGWIDAVDYQHAQVVMVHYAALGWAGEAPA